MKDGDMYELRRCGVFDTYQSNGFARKTPSKYTYIPRLLFVWIGGMEFKEKLVGSVNQDF